MFDTAFAKFLEKKLKYQQLLFFIITMYLMGIIINYFEPYPFFHILAPVLLLMFFLTICIIQKVYKNITKFKEKYINNNTLLYSFNYLFNSNNKHFIITVFSLMVFLYFVCLYSLEFIKINIMGCYALSLGAGTFFLALIGYEIHIKLTICLVDLSKKDFNISLTYHTNNLQDTEWLLELHKLSKLLRMASFILGLLFVLENALFFIVNIQQYQIRFEKLPIELWIIWVFIFLAIIFMMPIIALVQIQCLHKIVLKIKKNFNNQIFNNYTLGNGLRNALSLLISLQIINLVEKSLKDAFDERIGEKFIAFSTAILSNLIHILTIYSFWLNRKS